MTSRRHIAASGAGVDFSAAVVLAVVISIGCRVVCHLIHGLCRGTDEAAPAIVPVAPLPLAVQFMQ